MGKATDATTGSKSKLNEPLEAQDVRDEAMTCGDCGHRIDEECGHSGREIHARDLACDYFCSL